MLGMAKDKTGIYKIMNLQNGKLYVGSAAFIYGRWGQHRAYLRQGKHHNPHLQAAWNKYGADSFRFEVIEETTKDQLVIREQWWIDNTGCLDRISGYNMNPNASSCRGRKWSKQSREKLSQVVKGYVTEEHLAKMTAAAKQANIGRKKTEQELENWKKARSRWWLITLPDGTEQKIQNLSQFCREHKLSQSSMHRVAYGKLGCKQHKGYCCKPIG